MKGRCLVRRAELYQALIRRASPKDAIILAPIVRFILNNISCLPCHCVAFHVWFSRVWVHPSLPRVEREGSRSPQPHQPPRRRRRQPRHRVPGQLPRHHRRRPPPTTLSVIRVPCRWDWAGLWSLPRTWHRLTRPEPSSSMWTTNLAPERQSPPASPWAHQLPESGSTLTQRGVCPGQPGSAAQCQYRASPLNLKLRISMKREST
jgi:hypothetical protein